MPKYTWNGTIEKEKSIALIAFLFSFPNSRPPVVAVRPRPGDPGDRPGDARAGRPEALRHLLHDGLLQRLRDLVRVQGLQPPGGQGEFASGKIHTGCKGGTVTIFC